MSDIGALYAGLSPDVALRFLQSPATTTDRSFKDISRLQSKEDNLINRNFNVEVSSLNAALGNVQQSASLLQVVKNAYERISILLSELKSLADDAAAADSSSRDRAVLNDKFVSTRDKINAIANATTFRRANVVNADKTYNLQVGNNSSPGAAQVGTGISPGSTISVDVISALVADLATGLDTASLSTSSSASTAQTTVTTAQDNLNDALAAVTGGLTRLRTATRNLTNNENSNEELAKARQISVQVSDDILIKGTFFIQAQLRLLFVNFLKVPAKFFDISA